MVRAPDAISDESLATPDLVSRDFLPGILGDAYLVIRYVIGDFNNGNVLATGKLGYGGEVE